MSTITRTICISDVVDSTALAAHHGGTGADRLRRRYLASLRSAVDHHGGETVKNLGDGLLAAFDSTGAALRAATAMQARVSRLEAYAGGPKLQLRVGLAIGEVTAENEDYFGRPVVVASRLCDLAAPGEILAEALVARVAGDHGLETAPADPTELKGLPGTIDIVRVPWADDAGDDALLPPPLARHACEPFVGRDDELALVMGCWAAVEDGRGSTVLLRGPAGSGKTSFATKVATLAGADGCVVVAAAAEPGLGSAHHLAATVLRGLIRSPAADDVRRIVDRWPEVLRSLVDGTSRTRGRVDDVDRETLFEDVSEAVAAVAEHSPVLLVFDDLHWAASDGQLFVWHLARSLADAGIVILVLERGDGPRPGDVADTAAADLLRLDHIRVLELTGLADDDVRALVVEAGLDPAAASAIMAATGGLPFSVREVLRALRAGDPTVRLVDGDHGFRLEGVPATLHELLDRHLARFERETVRALAVGAALGHEFDADVVAGATGAPVRSALAPAIEDGLLREREPGRYEFDHDLVRQSLLADLHAGQLAELHRTIAGALADQCAPPARCCWHQLHGADPASAAEAVDATLDAVHSARRHLGHQQLASHLQLALGVLDRFLPDDHRRRARVLLAIADVESWRNDADAVKERAVAAAKSAMAAGDALAAAEAAILYGSWVDAGTVDPVADRLFAAVTVAEAAEHDVSLAARLAAAAADYQSISAGRPEDGLPLAEEAVRLSTGVADDAARADALWAVANALLGSADAARRLAIAGELVDLGARYGPALVSAHRLAVHTCLAVGDLVGWAHAAAELGRLAERHGSGEARMWSSVVRAEELLRTGSSDEAEQVIEQFLVDWGHYPTGRSIHAAQRFQLERDLGRLELVLPILDELVESPTTIDAFRVAHLVSLVEVGRADDARRWVEELSDDDGLSSFRRDQAWVGTLCGLAEVAAAVRSTDLGGHVAPLLEPFAGQVAVAAQGVVSLGAVDRYRGLLAALRGDVDTASGAYARAAQLEARVAAPTQRARTLRAWADLERARDGRRAAEIESELRAAGEATTLGPRP